MKSVVGLLPYIIDIEASGFGSDSYPIEVGVITNTGDKYCALIRPDSSWTHWDPKAEQQHGISRGDLETCGKSARQVCDELNEFLAGKTVYSDAWTYDLRWLKNLFEIGGLDLAFKVSPIELISTEVQLGLWDKIKQETEKELSLERHRASSDAWLIQETFSRSSIQAANLNHQGII